MGYGLGWAQGTIYYRGSGPLVTGEGASHCKLHGLFAVSCAKMAEPIQTPFGMWTEVGPRKHASNGVHTGVIRLTVHVWQWCGKFVIFTKCNVSNYSDHLLSQSLHFMSLISVPRAFTHYCMDLDVTWGNGRGCPLAVHYWADLQSVHGFHFYDNIVWMQNVSECLYSVYDWF